MAWDNYPLYTDVMASPEFIAETSRTLRAELANFKKPVDVCVASKYATVDEIRCLYNEGFRVFGENKVQEAESKWKKVKEKHPNIRLHMVGKLQTNKVKTALNVFDYIHSVDNYKLAEKVVKYERELNKKVKIFHTLNECLAEKPDIGFITNETVHHIPIAMKLANAGLDLFLEKPLSNSKKDIK
mgnify:CR=1 FL=1